MIWQTTVPLPPQWLSSNYPTASIGVRQAKAAAAAKWKLECAEAFEACPVRGARFVRVTQFWYCVIEADMKQQPKRGKTVVSKSARKLNPYMPMDVYNALATCKPMIDALELVGIVPKDTAEFVADGGCDLWRTPQCRKHGITRGHIKVTLEIEEEGKLEI